MEIEKVDLNEAEGIVCTGPFDPHADPAVMRPQFLLAKTKGLKLLCANPDIVVDRGETREWCAGALAQLYTEMGGESLYFGKPHPPIYDLARKRLQQIDRSTPDDRILAIGDGIRTDVQGGMGENIDTLFITGGLAREETGTTDQPDPPETGAVADRCGDGADLFHRDAALSHQGFSPRLAHRPAGRPAPRTPGILQPKRAKTCTQHSCRNFYDVFAFYYFLHCRTPPRWRRRAPRCRRLKPCSTTS